MYAGATSVIRDLLSPAGIPDWWSCHDWGPTFAHSGAMMAKQLISPLHHDLNKSCRAEGGYDHFSFDESQLCVWQILMEKMLLSKPKQPSAGVKLQHCWRATDLREKIITGGQIIKIQCRQYLEGKYNQLWDDSEIWGVFHSDEGWCTCAFTVRTPGYTAGKLISLFHQLVFHHRGGLLVPDNSQAAWMHLTSLCFAPGFLQHPRNQKSLAAKLCALRGIAEADWDQPWVAWLALGSCEPLCVCEHQQHQSCPPLIPEEQCHSFFGYGWLLFLLRCAFFSSWCTGSPHPGSLLPHVSCKLFTVCPAHTSDVCSATPLLHCLSGEDTFMPIKLKNCQRGWDTVLVTGVTVNLVTWHREGNGKSLWINYSAEAVLRRAWLSAGSGSVTWLKIEPSCCTPEEVANAQGWQSGLLNAWVL